MREDNLLCLREKPFVPYTTNSRHEFPIVDNLTRGLIPTGLDQIWVADITYVRLAAQFVYLAVVLDAFSRKVIGWALADHLEASLAIEALDMALAAPETPRPASSITPTGACNMPVATIAKSWRRPAFGSA
jgi:transposase InsO family protein